MLRGLCLINETSSEPRDQPPPGGNWADIEVIRAIRFGVDNEQSPLCPTMPKFGDMTDLEANAIVAYLRSLPPVSHKVPGPFGPNDTPTVFVMSVQPGEVYAKLPKPPQ